MDKNLKRVFVNIRGKHFFLASEFAGTNLSYDNGDAIVNIFLKSGDHLKINFGKYDRDDAESLIEEIIVLFESFDNEIIYL